MNKVILMGRLTKDVELKYSQSGVAVCNFSIAVDRKFQKQGEQRQADFINCVAWRQQAEFLSKYFGKGRMIAVIGSIQTRTWEGTDGKKNYVTEVVVDEINFTGERSSDQNSGSFDKSFEHAPNDFAPPSNSPMNAFTPVDSDDELPF
ncbi:MAG: single-stranded DNA-binding protein [Hyphomonadaceae bacterium]|nr:single-stranded DNA-binding protein [Clostridia bacterium]